MIEVVFVGEAVGTGKEEGRRFRWENGAPGEKQKGKQKGNG